ncbi:MAG: hypothetical protein Q8N46_01305 [Anaerolineales bacterium]|nr:hypothetical protein [Thiobacillus sp.]MDP2993737.1 hypothetical protein [Anaerolineales bacterium]
MADAPKLTRLHRLTDEEADLIMDYRLLHPEIKATISVVTKYQAERYAEPTTGNVVSIVRR